MRDQGKQGAGNKSGNMTADDVPGFGSNTFGHSENYKDGCADGSNNYSIKKVQEKEDQKNSKGGTKALPHIIFPMMRKFINLLSKIFFHLVSQNNQIIFSTGRIIILPI